MVNVTAVADARRATGGIGDNGQVPRTIERRASIPDRKADHCTCDRLVVSITDFDERRDRGFLLHDVDRVLTFDDDDVEAARGGRRRRASFISSWSAEYRSLGCKDWVYSSGVSVGSPIRNARRTECSVRCYNMTFAPAAKRSGCKSHTVPPL
jgi:hypothetical protein